MSNYNIGKKKKAPIQRRRRKSGKSRKLYFGPDTDKAICDFQNSECNLKKEKLYETIIQPSFDKLSENLIFIHGFSKNHYSYEVLKSDCVSFLYETLKKFDATRGTKAFSYFNVVAKNWLIIQSKKKMKNIARHVSLSDFNDMKSDDKSVIENYHSIPSHDLTIIAKENKAILFEMLSKIKKRISSPNEIACMNAIFTLFNKVDELDFLNKRAVFVYLRDISGLSPKQLSVAMSNIRKHYREIKKCDNDYFSLFF